MSDTRDEQKPFLRHGATKLGVGDDLRAAPFTDQVFDDDYYGRGRRGRSYGFLLGIVLGAVVAASVWYFAFRTPNLPTMASGESSVIKAESTPYKMKPSDPGGLQVANQDKLVYDRVAKGEAPPQVENLLPPAEGPKEPPPRIVEAIPKSASTAVEKQPAMEKVEEASGGHDPVSEGDPLEKAMAEITNESNKAAESASKGGEPKTQMADPSWRDGAYLVQLVAVLSNEGAEGEWKRLVEKHKTLLGGLRHVVLEADLGDRGVFYRLRAGPLAGRSEADELCSALIAKNAACIVVSP